MAKTLKSQNTLRLLALLVLNLAVYHSLASKDELLDLNFGAYLKNFKAAVPAGFGLAAISVICAQLTSTAKARLVYWRWTNPLPGSEAFTRLGDEDPRVDMKQLAKKYNPLPVDAREQNNLWFRLYKECESEPAVEHAHREFLFTRDYAAIAALAFVVVGSTACMFMPSWRLAAGYCGLLVVQFILASQAARNNGRSLVTSVLAIHGART
jgi:hypothetical protein